MLHFMPRLLAANSRKHRRQRKHRSGQTAQQRDALARIELLESRQLLTLPVTATFPATGGGSNAPPSMTLNSIETANVNGRVASSTVVLDGTIQITGRSTGNPVASPGALEGVSVLVIDADDNTVASTTFGNLLPDDLNSVVNNGPTPTSFLNTDITLTGLSGTNTLRLRLTGGTAPRTTTSGSFTITVDQTGPEVASFVLAPGNVQNRNVDDGAVQTVTINFDATDTNPATFTQADLTLEGPSGTITIPAGRLTQQDSDTWALNVNGLTGADGMYQLTVSEAGLADDLGNSGTGSESISWTQDLTVPMVGTPALDPDDDTPRSMLPADSFTDSDGVTMQTMDITLAGTATEGDSVQVDILNAGTMTVVDSRTVTATATGYSAEFAMVPEGSYDLRATADDGVNDPVVSATGSLVIDVTDPVKPIVSALITNASPATLTLSAMGGDVIENTDAVTVVRDSVNQTTFAAGEDPVAVPRPDATVELPSEGTFVVQAFLTDLAGNSDSATLTSDPVDFVLDQKRPTFLDLRVDASDNEFPDSRLPVFVTTEPDPLITWTLNDQSYQALANDFSVSIFHVAGDGTETLLNSKPEDPVSLAPFDMTKQGSVTANQDDVTTTVSIVASDLVNMFGTGLHILRVRATDAAGNVSANVSDVSDRERTDIQVLTGFNPVGGDPTPDAPGTPVLTDQYDLTDILDDGVENRPSQTWQMGFDKQTQTVWVNTELGNRTFQIDPATGNVTRLDLSILTDNMDVPGNPELLSVETGLSVATDLTDSEDESLARPGVTIDNPHGIFFDFETALTPRVWIAHRTAGGATAPLQDSQGEEVNGGRLSYYDLVSNEFVTYEFSDVTLNPQHDDHGDHDDHDHDDHHEFHVEDLHAVFVDDAGVIWTVGTHANVIFEVRVDTLNPQNREALVIPHIVPEEFNSGGNPYDPHGIDVIVDERTGEKYVWLIPEGGPSRLGLLRPHFVEDDAPGMDDDIDGDAWVAFDLDPLVDPDPNWRGTFLKVDDNETPGIPEDDIIIGTFPVANEMGPDNTAGLLQVLDPGSVAVNPNDTSEPAELDFYFIEQIVGGGGDLAAINQPYLDREGNVYFIDRFGAVGRVDLNTFALNGAPVPAPMLGLTPPAIVATSPAAVTTTFPDPSDSESPFNDGRTQVFDAAPLLNTMELTATPMELDDTSRQLDRARTTGLDLYEVANSESGGSKGRGVFRGAFNATSTLYTSLAQNDDIASTAFAETTRRRMSVVTSDGDGRMAFQTMRNGSLLMTARGDGDLFDEQINLTREIVLRDQIDTEEGPFREIAIDGDPSALREDDGAVHVFGRNFDNNVVIYQFDPGTGLWDTDEIDTPDGMVLVGNPVAFNDGDRGPAAIATTADGSLLIYRPDGSVDDLTSMAADPNAARVYANPGVVDDAAGGRIYVYGADMSGNMVQYRFNRTGATVTSLVADTLTVPMGARPAGQTERETRIVQDVDVVVSGVVRHVFATDGHSRLVHWEVTGDDTVNVAENVTVLIADTTDDNTVASDGSNVDTNGDDRVTGYFAYQNPFVARVYSEVAPVVEPDGSLTVYGTNGGDLVLFQQQAGEWHAANLSRDANPADDPNIFTPANFVFGASGAYLDSNDDRHSLQINGKAEVVEYIFDRSTGRFSTQNINLARSNAILDLTSLDAPVDVVGGPTETIIDNGAAGYSVVLGTSQSQGNGLNGDEEILGGPGGPNDGSSIAQWEFTGLAAGDYRVSATWTANANNAGDAVFVVITEDSTAGQIRVNQQQTPTDFTNNGAFWQDLLTSVSVNDGTLTVLLGDDANGRVIADAIRIERIDPLRAAGAEVTSSSPRAAISVQTVETALDAAVSILSTSLGLPDADAAQLDGVIAVVTDLPGAQLGGASGNQIFIDVNAAGYGWFVDTTPHANEEFAALLNGELQAESDSAAAGNIDLLTVLLHELSHTLGHEHSDDDHSLMSPELGTGTRRLPDAEHTLDDQFTPDSGVLDIL